ncbi:MAG: histidine kinase [Bacteroidota bacterium]
MIQKLLRHIFFWLIYFGVLLFNDVFLSYSSMSSNTPDFVIKSILSIGLILMIKIPLVYYVIYVLIPRWQRLENRVRLGLEFCAALIIALVVYRILMHLLIWPHIWNEFPKKQSFLQYTARIFYSLLDVLQVVTIAAAIRLLKLRIAAVKKEKVLIQEKLHSELQQLKSQVNPHFLFNSLNSIYALSRNHSEETPAVVLKLSGILRYMLYENNKSLVAIGGEIKIIEDYLELQQVRFGKKRKVILHKTIHDANVAVPPLIILPLLENAFKHGAADGEPAQCKIFADSKKLEVIMTNPVSGIAGLKQENDGIGLSNIQRQLELMYRDFQFNYFRNENLFTVNLTINLASYAGDELFDSRG